MSRNLTLEPESEVDSLIQPGRRVFDTQLPPELPGTLETLGDPLAEGSFAVVFRGRWTSPGEAPKTVAIKRVKLQGNNISPDRFRTRIRRETVIWTTTTAHPNILSFFGYQIVNGLPMLVSPWCQNGNLSVYISNNPHITRGEKIKLLCDAARGLVYLHGLDPQIVHGDIKPENVIIQDDLVAALCDFGISKVHVGLEQHSGLTTSGKTGGTSGYQAKEILNDGPATPASDVYAFGGLMLAAMSGYQPFWKKRQASTIIAVFSDQTPAPNDHPKLPPIDTLWVLLRDCWKGDASSRPPMSEVLQRLESEPQRQPSA